MLAALTVSVPGAQGPASRFDEQKADRPDQQRLTAAERLYPASPDGVDPITTGPVSQGFRERQLEARCAEAEWPNIPIACYP